MSDPNAADSDSTGIALHLIEKGADPNVRNDRGEAPLHNAACRGSLGVVWFLLEKGISPDPRDSEGRTPLHVAALSHGLQFESVLVPSWAAAFSAYGCACADCAYRYDRTVDKVLPPDGSGHQAVAGLLRSAWSEIRERLAGELRRDGLDPERMVFRPYVRMQYRGMLDDLEIASPSAEPSREDLDAIIAEYERLFERIFARAAKSPEAGYVVTKAIGVGIVPTEKPRIPDLSLQGQEPAKGSMKGQRQIFWDGSWMTADLFEMDRLQPGNVVAGPAVVEAPATTLLVPPGWRANLDKNLIFRVEEV